MQRKDFDAALLQAKSLDMLRNEDGENVRNISKIAAEQKNYDVAIKGYQYVVNKGNSYPWFVTANLELINVQRDQIVATTRYNKNDLEQLKHTYIQFINAFKNDYTVVNATLELSQLEALYIHEIDSAINRIVPIVENTRTPKELLSKAKIYLGDYYLIADQYWESILLYTQVEKEQKGNPIGEEANSETPSYHIIKAISSGRKHN
ncbi:MAG: hypothetical protein IPL21_08975 [Saprospirales bacterium]|nr:hypothetical protein [Saprospirales bacterium]